MPQRQQGHTLEFLLAFDGRTHRLDQGYCLRFRIRRVPPTARRPHGLQCAFTLHDPDGNRLVGFDNAHRATAGLRRKASSEAIDHWHRAEGDKGRPYRFEGADKLLADFFAEVRRVLNERGISEEVRSVEEDAGDRSLTMTKPKIQRLDELEAEMRAVARSEKTAPKDAGAASFNSVVVLMRLLTPENRRLMATIRDKKPKSIAELAKLTGRAPSNLTRTLGKLEDAGLVKMRAGKKTKMPVPAVKVLRVKIDPFSQTDHLEMA